MAAVAVSCVPVQRWSTSLYLYPYWPTSFVMKDLRDGEGRPPPANTPSSYFPGMGHGWISESVDLSRVALDELIRRDGLGRLSAADRRKIDRLALADLPKPIMAAGQYYLRQYLGDQWEAGKLPPDLLKQLYATALHIRLDTDPFVWQWNEVPLRFSCQSILPGGTKTFPMVVARYESVRIDGKPVKVTPENWSGSNVDMAFQYEGDVDYGDRGLVAERSIRYWALGHHRIDVDLQVDVSVGVDIDGKVGRIVHTEVVPLHADFTEEEPPLLVKGVRFYFDPEHEAGHYLTAARLDAASKRGPTYIGHLARVELMRRGRLLELSPGEDQRLVDDMLQVQADRGRQWFGEYGDYIEWLHDQGRLPAAQWAAYGRHQLAFYIRGRPVTNDDKRLPFDFVEVARRGNSGVRRYTGGQWTTHIAFSDGIPGPIDQGPLNLGIACDGDEYSTPTYATFGSAKPGTHTMHAWITNYDLTWTERPAGLPIPTKYDLGRISFAVVPKSVDVAPAVVDPALAKPIAACVAFDDLIHWDDGSLTGSVAIRRPPVDVAFHVVLLAGGQQWPIGDFAVAKGDPVGYGTLQVYVKNLGQMPASGLTFKLTADPALAKVSPSLTHYWQGELVIDHVPARGQRD